MLKQRFSQQIYVLKSTYVVISCIVITIKEPNRGRLYLIIRSSRSGTLLVVWDSIDPNCETKQLRGR